jgi:RNA polymerase sigma-70 factor (ECF subfamily)
MNEGKAPPSDMDAYADEAARSTDDRATFGLLFERYERRVLAYCLRRSATAADGEDATAEAFAVAWRRRRDAPVSDRALPWLYGIARRVLANQRRGNERRLRLSIRLRETVSDEGSYSHEPGPAIAALTRLRPDDQEILRLVAWEELGHPEIAQVLGVSLNAVATRLHRARLRFEVELRAGSQPDALKEIEGRRTSSRLKGRMIGLFRREPTK